MSEYIVPEYARNNRTGLSLLVAHFGIKEVQRVSRLLIAEKDDPKLLASLGLPLFVAVQLRRYWRNIEQLQFYGAGVVLRNFWPRPGQDGKNRWVLTILNKSLVESGHRPLRLR